MRSKSYGINVRVTEQEKQKLLENARFCSLSLSEYLRRLGLGKEVKAAITERDYHLFRMMNGLKAEFKKIIWPDQKSLVKQTGAVVAVSIVLGVMIALLDFIFQYGVDILVNISF